MIHFGNHTLFILSFSFHSYIISDILMWAQVILWLLPMFQFSPFSTNFSFYYCLRRVASVCYTAEEEKSLLSVYLCEFSQVFSLLSFLSSCEMRIFVWFFFVCCSIKKELFFLCERRTIWQARLGIQDISIISFLLYIRNHLMTLLSYKIWQDFFFLLNWMFLWYSQI